MVWRRLYTYFDIEYVVIKSKLAEGLPENVIDIRVYPDKVIVFLEEPGIKDKVKEKFVLWFGPKFNLEDESINLEDDVPRVIKVEFEVSDKFDEDTNLGGLMPQFSQISLLPETGTKITVPLRAESSLPVIAFYSFKGGVGRTLHLLALAKVLSEKNYPLRLLIVDADLEAPGLSWWIKDKIGEPEISFLDFLALVHTEEDTSKAIKLVAKVLKGQPIIFDSVKGKPQHYFLPAFRDLEQLFSMPLRPEHLIQVPGKEWIITEAITRLGKELGVDAVLIDLRAGVSELSSPILFDPRIVRIIVSTTSDQSIAGTKAVLSQMRKVQTEGKLNYGLPFVILSMIPDHLRLAPETDRARDVLIKELLNFLSTTKVIDQEEMTIDQLMIDTSFNSDLLNLGNLENTLEKLNGTSLIQTVSAMIDQLGFFQKASKEPIQQSGEDNKRKLENLKDRASLFEYAEKGYGSEFLAIPSLKNLGQKFQESPPIAVVMGSKGSGKTFLFLQLARVQYWTRFLKEIGFTEKSEWGLILPVTRSKNLEDKAIEIVKRAKHLVHETLKTEAQIGDEEIQEKIESNITSAINQSNWRKLWFKIIADSIGIHVQTDDPLKEIQSFLRNKNEKVIAIFDGIEDLFQNLSDSTEEQKALRALCQDVPNSLKEWPNNHLGIVLVLRKDMAKSAIVQNFGQYESLYGPFELKWNQEEALRLVTWLAEKVLNIDYSRDELLKRNKGQLEQDLYPLWGKKLGKPESNEAYTSNWVIAALSDYRGQLQARDVVRLIKRAAELALSSPTYPGRLLPPASIRNALDYCSEKKIEDIQLEVMNLKPIFYKLRRAESDKRVVPFEPGTFDLTHEEIKLLEEQGIVFQDRSGEDGLKEVYYMPEIFRRGLDFKLNGGSRPRVLALMRKALLANKA